MVCGKPDSLLAFLRENKQTRRNKPAMGEPSWYWGEGTALHGRWLHTLCTGPSPREGSEAKSKAGIGRCRQDKGVSLLSLSNRLCSSKSHWKKQEPHTKSAGCGTEKTRGEVEAMTALPGKLLKRVPLAAGDCPGD